MVTDHDRHELYTALLDRLGQRPADVLMDLLPPVGWADVARKSDIDQLRTEMDARFDRVDARFLEVNARFDKQDAKIEHILARVVYANLLLAIAVGGFVLAAARLGG